MSARSLPRIFLPGADVSGPVELPKDEFEKLHKVLRLKTGDRVAILPDDGTLWICRLEGRSVIPIEKMWPETEPNLEITLLQALPKADRLETSVRMCVEIGVRRFVLFPAERSVVRWEPSKLEAKIQRLKAIVREAAEQSYRSRLPEISVLGGLEEAMFQFPDTIVLSEREGIGKTLAECAEDRLADGANALSIMIGPEGGWAPRELDTIGDRGVTLGPLVLRTDTAGPAAAAAVLFGIYAASRKNSFST